MAEEWKFLDISGDRLRELHGIVAVIVKEREKEEALIGDVAKEVFEKVQVTGKQETYMLGLMVGKLCAENQQRDTTINVTIDSLTKDKKVD
jgi:hypothetical protein